ncbi:MAG: 8-amino-7-oxononanoate synthase [Alphaproteobacteria bacterium]|nr:8-amino-7-oxononanoate synthase [Alphaproteobacteria bacterium]
MVEFSKKLARLKADNRLRSLRLPCGIDLTSNDYLGLKDHPRLRTAAISALEKGVEIGAGGSRLLRGHTEEHAALEDSAARFFACEKTLYFSTGFQANTALFTALAGRHDTIIFDALIHASARDGIQASAARHIRVPHNDIEAYGQALERAKSTAKTQGGRIFIAVESLYSMDGDFAPLPELYALANAYEAILIIDEAHATGVWGPDGRGLAAALWADDETAQQPANIVTLHTCGKALGIAGGMVCASADIVDYLVNTARPFIYSTAPIPLQAVLVREALALAGSAEGRKRRAALHQKCTLMKTLLEEAAPDLMGTGWAVRPSQIVPLMFGEDSHAVAAAQTLQAAGYDIRPIRPPTVPEGTARLRLSLSAILDDTVLRGFTKALSRYSDWTY